MIVDPDAEYRDLLLRVTEAHASAEAVADFPSAYTRLTTVPPDLVVTNLRLNANVEGLQLAYVIASAGYATRTVIYSERIEPWLVSEVQRIGAFYESRDRLCSALPAYAQACSMPLVDRRDPLAADRRSRFRGGRRSTDGGIAPPA